ncbi:CBS domain-containing protein [Phaeodactylibacter luteus]|uniref:CBS domain-containing protein n=1 Tax=Phaeodactylibacter luteus TaxID=1564516 RepID=A0A5C6RJ07_9BACT|nr:CBS domain-containing protein [Phaeodactylibacter luteus]TXB62406.1 CBS domain-containing protein [Phaeodactylibacter luteus]
MNILDPVKSIMTTNLLTVTTGDKLTAVKEIFDNHRVHHIPVVRYKELVGIISKTDFLHFLRGFNRNAEDEFVNEARMRAYKVEDIMTKGIAKLAPEDRINVALEIFLENRFHAIPVVNAAGELEGLLTTFDIIKTLAQTPVSPEDILESRKH